ncbi:MAG: ribose-phosphate pyrophosphokinase [Bacteroidales bacterium]|nr:ribose-phosphate pyrophosphokinase [Bacteroidales bacterium]NLK81002.1 ribose-phosphate pyrophosphokinase [Bacteroidales bacterium]HPY82797.1 ribose-phosphate pyrophosphokinase [Bacteroidales bacterium]
MEKHPIKIFSGTATEYLTRKIVKYLGVELGGSSVTQFSDGEFEPRFDVSVRGCDVYIVQSTFSPADNLLELLLMVDAAKRASAWQVTAVIPYFGFARQDRKDKSRVSIGAKLMANLLTAAGVGRVITMDLHAGQIQGFFDVPVDHLYASSIFVPYLRNLQIPDLLIAAPDMGGTKRAKSYAKFLDADIAICHKTRTQVNVVDSMEIIGDVAHKNVIIVDDMIDTAGTIVMAANLVMEKGAKSVRALSTHAVCSGEAFKRIEESAIQELIITDTIFHAKVPSKITILSCAEFLADCIKKVYENTSISSNFIMI